MLYGFYDINSNITVASIDIEKSLGYQLPQYFTSQLHVTLHIYFMYVATLYQRM